MGSWFVVSDNINVGGLNKAASIMGVCLFVYTIHYCRPCSGWSRGSKRDRHNNTVMP